jgi:HK97 family phage major capsid protein
MKHVSKKALLGSVTLMERKGDEDDPVALVTKALDDLSKSVGDQQKTLDDRLKVIETKGLDAKLTDRLDKIEAKVNRPGVDKEEKAEPTAEKKAFASYLRNGDKLPDEERKALTVANDTSGGYLAPADFQTEIIKNVVEVSPIRQAARVSSTSAGEVILPKRTGTPSGSWVGETETRPETGSTYGQVEIPIHEMAAYVDVSLKLLEDAAVDIEAEVASDLGEEFGRMEGAALVIGNGFKKPVGVMINPEVPYTFSGNAATLGAAPADLLITAMYALKKPYRANGVWMMNGTTLASIRKLKDGQNNFLWQPSYQAGQPETILGRPVIEAPDMPDIGAGTEPIIFGDFNRAYRIFDRVGMSVFMDPYTQRTQGKVRFHGRRRVGAGLVLAEALRKIRCATS